MLFITLLVVFAATASALFSGSYSDPNHPGCARVIVFETDSSAKVFGADAAGGEGATCDGATDVRWGPLPAVVSGSAISVDFSSKGGPSDLSGNYNDDTVAIDWADGNSWPKIFPKEDTASLSIFDGEYSDPNHPSCARFVMAESETAAQIYGADAAGGEGAMCDGVTDVAWNVPAQLDTQEIVADFSSKGGPAGLKGTYNVGKQEIDWEDGNAWPKVKMAAAKKANLRSA